MTNYYIVKGTVLFLTLFLGVTSPSHADTTKFRIIDGKAVVIDSPSKRNNFRINCAGAKYSLKSQSLENQAAKFFIDIRFGSGDKKTKIVVTDKINNLLTPDHSILNAEYGCLTGGGGLGLRIPAVGTTDKDLYIQISAQGRVFKNYDQTGYKIVNPN